VGFKYIREGDLLPDLPVRVAVSSIGRCLQCYFFIS
jgi:hypothetical protein